MTKDEKFLKQAYLIAEDSPRFADARIGAIAVLGNQIVSVGYNTSKKHPIATRYGSHSMAIFPHAELLVIHNGSKRIDIEDWRRVTIYVARAKNEINNPKRWIQGLAKPCRSCQKAIEAFGIKKIIYTEDDSGFGVWKRGQSSW